MEGLRRQRKGEEEGRQRGYGSIGRTGGRGTGGNWIRQIESETGDNDNDELFWPDSQQEKKKNRRHGEGEDNYQDLWDFLGKAMKFIRKLLEQQWTVQYTGGRKYS